MTGITSHARNNTSADGGAALPRAVRRRLWLARAALLAERILPAHWPGSGIIAAYLAAALFGVWTGVPMWLHGLALMATLAAAVMLTWRQLRAVRWPGDEEALRRLERDSALDHRPLTSYADSSATDLGDPGAAALWRAHRRWLGDRIRALTLRLPRSSVPARDPYALRFVVLLAVLVGLGYAGPQAGERLAAAFTPESASVTAAGPRFDAWVDPPGYTRIAPFFLSGANARYGDGATVPVPHGATLTLRAHSERAEPRLRIEGAGDTIPFAREEAGTWQLVLPLTADAGLRVTLGGRTLGHWSFAVTPDHPPHIAFAGDPAPGSDGALKLDYVVSDDYGVVEAELHIRPAGGADNGVANTAEALHAIERDGVLIESLPLSRPGLREGEEKAEIDLTAHPWAGLEVEMRLVARDEAGQEGTSRTITMALPERLFFEPLARAVIEQRRELARDLRQAGRVARVIDAITYAPERFIGDTTVYLALRSAYHHLTHRPTAESIRVLIDDLWDLALYIEDGGVAAALRRVQQIQKALMDALARGAPDHEIARLMDELRDAVERYVAMLQALGMDQEMAAGMQGQSMDLSQFLSAIEELARLGSRDAARAMLSELTNMLRNLRFAGRGEGGMTAQEEEMARMLEELGDIIGRQRGLLDETFRRDQDAMRRFRPGEDEGEGGEGALAERQEELRERLGELREGLGEERGDGAGEALGESDEAMGGSAQSLRRGDTGTAQADMEEAIEALRRGAEGLARRLMESMAARMGQDGAGERDPLGRSTGGMGFGESVRVPDEMDMQRAREILDELRRRAEERNRPQYELDYLERLLRRF